MAVQATFHTMGLRTEKAVAAHLLLENTHKSNLVCDIARVDYLAGNLGCTHLRPWRGFQRSSTTYTSLATCAAKTA